MNRYINAFLSDVTWFAKATDIELIKEEEIIVPYDFTSKFPQMSELLKQAIKLEIVVKKKRKEIYWLICWTKGNIIRGWLCLPPECKIGKRLPKSYQIVLNVFGGIIESFGLNSENNFLLNMDSVLCLKDAMHGIDGWENYYYGCCEQESVTPKIDLKKLIVIAREANGNLTLCDSESEEILLFAHDHNFTNVVIYDNCPEYTFYKIRECSTFQIWLEKIALQWRL